MIPTNMVFVNAIPKIPPFPGGYTVGEPDINHLCFTFLHNTWIMIPPDISGMVCRNGDYADQCEGMVTG
jgi:hypothetical protein